MILLYDELMIQESDPNYNYSKIQEVGKFKIYPFEEFYFFDAVHQENNSLYAESLKPAIMKYLKKEMKSYFVFDGDRKTSYSKMISELYDLIFQIKGNISKGTLELIELNEAVYKLKNRKNISEMRKLNAPVELTDKRFSNKIVN